MIAKEIQDILYLPEYYTDEYNATPMKNYWPFLRELVEIINPKSVCEIGSERGLTSQLLGQVFKNIEKLHIVDPFINKELKENKPDNMILHEEISLEFLKKELEVELYLIDGDHNYYTVKNELLGVQKNRNNKQKTFILMHDVSWMWARRDMYYNADSIPDTNENKYNTSLNLENKENVKYGFPSADSYSISIKDGGSKNGVLTAIEDFVKESDLKWNFSYIPSLWGLGFLWLEDNFTEEEVIKINLILNKLDSLKEFFGILEANRLRLLQGLDEWKGLSEERLISIKDIERIKDELYKVAEQRLSDIQNIVKEKDELYEVAEQRLSDIQNIVKEKDELYEIAEYRLNIINNLKKNIFIKWFIKE
ncbi:MAG: hypothetical protein DRG78_01185 [Epsilonproteobacteria bacterium]|nr:MAG: hypothetical protein DRG78_01185 [Campylobacterota bacterium]